MYERPCKKNSKKLRSETKILKNDAPGWNLTTLNYTTDINGPEQKKLSKIDEKGNWRHARDPRSEVLQIPTLDFCQFAFTATADGNLVFEIVLSLRASRLSTWCHCF